MEYISATLSFGEIQVETLEGLHRPGIENWMDTELMFQSSLTKFKAGKTFAQMAYELTTIVQCEFNGTEQLSDSVMFEFMCNKSLTPRKAYPHVLFVAKYGEQWVILGSLLNSTFDRLVSSNFCITFSDLQSRELGLLFDYTSMFIPIDYYALDGCEANPTDKDSKLGEKLLARFNSFELGQSHVFWSRYEPFVFRWMLFLVSGCDYFTDKFIEFECKQLEARLQQLKHNPLLQFEYAKKWLRWDITPKAIETHRFANDIQRLEFGTPMRILHDHCAEHYFDAPSHVFTIPIDLVPWQRPLVKCIQCLRYDCTKCVVAEGKLTIPIQMTPHLAGHVLKMRLRDLIKYYRRTYGTRYGFDVWVELGINPSNKDIEAHVKQMFNEVGRSKRSLATSAIEDFIRTEAKRADEVRLFTDLDYLIVKQIVLPLWKVMTERDIVDYAPIHSKEEPKAIVKPMRPPSRTATVFNFDHIDRKEQLDTEFSKAPCVKRMIDKCSGSTHIDNNERVQMFRFITAKASSHEHAKELCLMLFEDTNIFRVTCNGDPEDFWKHDIGLSFLYILENWTKRDPTCKSWIEKDICVHAKSGVGDIEDLMKTATHICTDMVNEQRRANGKYSLPPKFQIWSPMKILETLV